MERGVDLQGSEKAGVNVCRAVPARIAPDFVYIRICRMSGFTGIHGNERYRTQTVNVCRAVPARIAPDLSISGFAGCQDSQEYLGMSGIEPKLRKNCILRIL
jgi:hypothetical protein